MDKITVNRKRDEKLQSKTMKKRTKGHIFLFVCLEVKKTNKKITEMISAVRPQEKAGGRQL